MAGTGPILLKNSNLPTQQLTFDNIETDIPYCLNHSCVEHPITIRLLLAKTCGRVFQHNRADRRLTAIPMVGHKPDSQQS